MLRRDNGRLLDEATEEGVMARLKLSGVVVLDSFGDDVFGPTACLRVGVMKLSASEVAGDIHGGRSGSKWSLCKVSR